MFAQVEESSQGSGRGSRAIGLALSLAMHGAALVALLSVHTTLPAAPTGQPMVVELQSAAPAAASAPTVAPPTASTKALRARTLARPVEAPVRAVTPLAVGTSAEAESGSELTGAELAGARTAGSGASGRPCDMASRVEGALRRDPLVAAAASPLAGKAVKVWDGDWVQGQGEDGKGLAAIREAIMWEVGFAPEACRSEPMHGLVLLLLDEPSGPARLVLGAPAWRWSDLLGRR